MINPFIGEFLVNPTPLEYSGNTCSHYCLYCFANCRKQSIEAKFKQTLSVLKGYPKSRTFTAELLRNGCPISLSNRTDPFSKTNIDQTISLFQYFNNMPNGLFFQTKGGERIFEALKYIESKKNVCVYITITTLDDKLSKVIEPNAPKTSERIAMAKQLKKLGYEIMIGINPVVEEWISENDIMALAKDLKEVGITHYFFQTLHFRSTDEIAINKILKIPNGKEIIEKAIKVHKPPFTAQKYLQKVCFRLINELQSNAVWIGLPLPNHTFDKLKAKLTKPFPSIYDFFNSCENRNNELIYFEDFKKSMTAGNEILFEKQYSYIQSYIFRINRNLWKGNEKIQSIRTMSELLNIFWNETKLPRSPQHNKIMFQVLKENGKNVLDENGNIILKTRDVFHQPDENGTFAEWIKKYKEIDV